MSIISGTYIVALSDPRGHTPGEVFNIFLNGLC